MGVNTEAGSEWHSEPASVFTPIQELAGHDKAAVVAAPFRQRQFRVKAFQHARQGCARLDEKLFAYQRIRISYITGIPPINDNFFGPGETFSGRQAIALLSLINGS